MSAEIIVVRYNQLELEERCLASVREHTNLNEHGLTVVDNYTRDKNLGALWNDLIAKSTHEFVCLLNSDTVVEAGWLQKLIACAHNTNAGAVGPMTDHCGTPQQKGTRGDGIVDVKYLSGFCLLLRRSAWVAAKGFREDAPFYGQESNLLTRVKRKVVCQNVFIHHEAGASVKAEGRATEEREISREWWRHNADFNWKTRVAILGTPSSPFPLWKGINQAVVEFEREGMAIRHFDSTVGRDVLEVFRPDVILLVSQRWNTISQCAKLIGPIKARKGIWFNDLRDGKEAGVLHGAFKKIFLCFKDSEAFPWKTWRDLSGGRIHYMPQGSVINTELEPLDIQGDVVFIGGLGNSVFHCGRSAVVQSLKAKVLNSIERPQRIRIEEQSRTEYRRARFSLAMSPVATAYNSIRLYNIMAYGGLALVARFPEIERLFRENEHFIGWSNLGEAREAIEAWRDRPEECERIRKRAWRYQQAKHTVANRIQNMITNLTTEDQSFWGYLPS